MDKGTRRSPAKRILELAAQEAKRLEAEKRRSFVPVVAEAGRTSPSPAEPTYDQLLHAVTELRRFCTDLEGQSAYLAIRCIYTKSSAQAEIVVGFADYSRLFESEDKWAVVQLSRTIRIGNIREDFERTSGVAEVVETGQVLRRVADLKRYLSKRLVEEIGIAVAHCRMNDQLGITDVPGATEQVTLRFALSEATLLLDHLILCLQGNVTDCRLNCQAFTAAEKAVAKLRTVKSKLDHVYSEYDIESLPALTLPQNVAWVAPIMEFRRVDGILAAAMSASSIYLADSLTLAKDSEDDLRAAEAKAERSAERAEFDVSLERRIARTIERLEDELADCEQAANCAGEVVNIFAECQAELALILGDVSSALYLRRNRCDDELRLIEQ